LNAAFFGNKLFAGVPPEELEPLEVPIELRHLEKGERLFDEGDLGDSFYLVNQGTVCISKSGRGGEQETLVLIEAGDYFGEMAMLNGRPRSARCCAVTPAVIGRMDEKGFKTLMGASPQIAVNFSRITAQRLRQTNQHFIQQLLQGERLSLLGRMVGAMVHDFRNPMATILMGTRYLKKHGQDEVSQQLATAIDDAVDRMMQMTNELLDFSRGVSNLNLERVTIEQLMRPVDEDVLSRLERGVQVDKRIDYAREIEVDRHRIARLLVNVVKNALEAMPSGGKLTISADHHDQGVLLTISDTGCGMSSELASRVFEPFFTHGKSQGTGLGMSIAKSAVEAHGGKIWIDSQEGQGTSVFMLLPHSPSEGQRAAAGQP
jgi:signal transduction histidine kinase